MARGSIYPRKLKDRTTVYDVRYRTSNGVAKQKRGFRKEREAVKYLNAQMAAVDRGEVVAGGLTFAEYFDDWLAEHRPRIEEGTYRDYEVHGRLRLKPFFGSKRLEAITQKDVRRYVADLRATGKAGAKTINNSIIVLRVCLGHAEEDGLIAKNPAASKPGSRERIKVALPHREMDYLRLDEIPRYLASCDEHYRPIAETFIATGLRVSELIALTWQDIDLDARVIRVVRSRQGSTDGSTKGDRFRSVDFGPGLERTLRDLKARRGEGQAGDLVRLPVFIGRRGGGLNRSDLSRDVHKAVLRDAGLRTSLRLHDLRHTAAASWLAAELPLIYVQKQLGHAQITTTQAIYGHLEQSFLRDAATRAEQLVRAGRLPTLVS
ncbi:MAG TPA: site-specific integrase [Solirubrobacteraceae bacterium]|nr:site-specific integrase [Solirubrobacteraceae bacterium]